MQILYERKINKENLSGRDVIFQICFSQFSFIINFVRKTFTEKNFGENNLEFSPSKIFYPFLTFCIRTHVLFISERPVVTKGRNFSYLTVITTRRLPSLMPSLFSFIYSMCHGLTFKRIMLNNAILTVRYFWHSCRYSRLISNWSLFLRHPLSVSL